MDCLKCGGFLQVEEYAYGEPPAVRCLNCGWRPALVKVDPPPRAPLLPLKEIRRRRTYQCKRLALRYDQGLCRACPNLHETDKIHFRKCLTRQAKRASDYYHRNRSSVRA